MKPCLAAAVGAVFVHFSLATASAAPSTDHGVDHGRYLAVAGDCAACHTRAGGRAYSGGRPLRSGPNTIYSMNITPDAETGIGRWTAKEFYRALHDGLSPSHGHLYPAFPFPHFRLLTRSDSDDLFAYLRTLKPVRYRPPPDRIVFPLRIRGLMFFWDALYLQSGRYKPNPEHSVQWNRGAELVHGLGHCGDCHTPRNFLFAEERDRFLQGANVEGWFAPDLTQTPRSGLGGWSASEIAEFLRTGRNSHEWAVGSMREVIADSTGKLSESDVDAIGAYLKSLPSKRASVPAMPRAEDMQAGMTVYVQHCAICHGENGRARDYPSLAGNTLVQATKATTVLRVILDGSQSIAAGPDPVGDSMPAFHGLSDNEVANVATFIRNAWGNAAAPVEASTVARIRRP